MFKFRSGDRIYCQKPFAVSLSPRQMLRPNPKTDHSRLLTQGFQFFIRNHRITHSVSFENVSLNNKRVNQSVSDEAERCSRCFTTAVRPPGAASLPKKTSFNLVAATAVNRMFHCCLL